MAYTKNTWVDQDVERPKTYEVTNNQDGSITLTDSFGVVTELGTPVNATNMNHIEDGILGCYNDLVNKSGDTMTGDLAILSDNGHFAIKSSFDSTTTTAPSEFVNLGTLAMYDTNDNYTGYFQNSINTDNAVGTAIGARRIIDGAYKTAALTLKVDASGYSHCTFPNTTCVDGQWVKLDQIIMNNVNLNGTSTLTYTLPLPNDGYDYEVLLSGSAITGTTSGNAIVLQLSSNIVGSNIICWTTNRGTSGISARTGGNGIIPVSSSHKIFVSRGDDYTGTASLYMRAYRRIGTNA